MAYSISSQPNDDIIECACTMNLGSHKNKESCTRVKGFFIHPARDAGGLAQSGQSGGGGK